MGSCYQFNNQEVLTWKEAYVSCQNQGADLLSIHSTAELAYITGRFDLPVVGQMAGVVKTLSSSTL